MNVSGDQKPLTPQPYIGRFAPSPTGPLHFGSLVSALASFLDARHNNGKWLVRIEDIDPPREVPGASSQILRSLKNFGLTWDDNVIYQSQRLELYRDINTRLIAAGLAYTCDCSRKDIKAMGPIYNQRCRFANPQTNKAATRLSVNLDIIPHYFIDLIQGRQSQLLVKEVGDFIIYRKDQLPAYQLAVCIDDLLQGITHVIRGHDLITSTQRQRYLMALLQQNHLIPIKTVALDIHYGHIPVATHQSGQKLSKQSFAPDIDQQPATQLLFRALQFLNQQPPHDLLEEQHLTLLKWAIENWNLESIPAIAAIAVE